MKTVAALLASVAAVFGMNTPTTTTPAIDRHCVTISRYLSVGSIGTDVVELQKFLGVKSTGFFGPQTKTALVKWQVDSKVLASAKSEGAGGVGPKTRLALRCVPLVATTTPKIVPTTAPVVIPSITTSTSSPSTVTLPPVSGGGGGTSGPPCAPFTTPKPAASLCASGEWVLVSDEMSCPAEWDCENPDDLE